MKLQFPFIQLPLRFDAAALAAEVATVDESEWRPHPQGYPGNFGLPLVAAEGDPSNESLAGPMRPTPVLARMPYLRQVLGTLGVVYGHTRLMRLSGQAEVSPHVDQAYYWAERMRVHVPIVTQPGVRFHCGAAAIHMAAGECWIFDTWRMHRVLNQGDAARIHLVADTVGGDAFWEHMVKAKPHHLVVPGWAPREVPPEPAGTEPEIHYESVNAPTVMSPWELRSHLSFLFGEMAPNQPGIQQAQRAGMRFVQIWQALWARHGDAPSGHADFRRLRDAFIAEMEPYRGRLALRNQVDFQRVLMSMVLRSALAVDTPTTPPAYEERVEGRSDVEIERPVFIMSPPRSGSTLLFEMLAQARGAYTIGDESHGLIEGVPGLNVKDHGFDSNRLDASHATPEVAAELRRRFAGQLRDRDGLRPGGAAAVLIEKTPKNSLRVPFLAKVFPQARFVFLYRDVRETLSSMIEAWRSGRFVTYPRLPGWNGELSWSLLLTPGWRELSGSPLPEIVARQWETATRILLDDLAAIAPERITIARYDSLLANPMAEIAHLCTALDLEWDRPIDKLPLSRYTVTPPDSDKWKRHESEIMAVLPAIRSTAERAEKFAVR